MSNDQGRKRKRGEEESLASAALLYPEEEMIEPREDSISKLNEYLQQIIDGQEDVTRPAKQARQEQESIASALITQINQLIVDKEQKQIARQEAAEAQQLAIMDKAEAEEIIRENSELINTITRVLSESQARIPRNQRIAVNERIIKTITEAVTNQEVIAQLENESMSRENIRGLFNGLITYYTEMASYGYERGPDILAKIGAVIAGSTLIGSTIYSQMPPSSNLLMLLGRYLTTATTTASGLYFLQQGGLPIRNMLQTVGGQTVRCLQTGCDVVKQEMNKMYGYGLDALGAYVNNLDFDWNFEDGSVSISTVSSADSTASTASSAAEAIDEILSVTEEKQKEILLEEILEPQIEGEITINPEVVGSQLTDSQNSSISDIDRDLYGDIPVTNPDATSNDIDGGRIRKSRRHVKSKQTKKGKKGRRKGRKTRKGKKHRKTLKRYKRKMRR